MTVADRGRNNLKNQTDGETELPAPCGGLASLCLLLGYDRYVARDKRRESVKASMMYSVLLFYSQSCTDNFLLLESIIQLYSQ